MRSLRFASACFVLAPPVLAALAGRGGASPVTTQTQSTTPSITVTGSNQVRLGATDSFAATVTNLANTAVTWQVNGVAGGNSTVGTITSVGVYTPPTAIPANNVVTITAVSTASSGTSGFLQVSILNPIPAVTVVNPNPVSATSNQASATVYVTTVAAAARLLDQATFGPTLTDIQHVRRIGLDGWITEQFNTPDTPLANIPADPLFWRPNSSCRSLTSSQLPVCP